MLLEVERLLVGCLVRVVAHHHGVGELVQPLERLPRRQLARILVVVSQPLDEFLVHLHWKVRAQGLRAATDAHQQRAVPPAPLDLLVHGCIHAELEPHLKGLGIAPSQADEVALLEVRSLGRAGPRDETEGVLGAAALDVAALARPDANELHAADEVVVLLGVVACARAG